MRFPTLIALFLLIAFSPVLAQDVGSISGVVTDPNGDPILDARVIMTSDGLAPLIADTDEEGSFAFEEAAAAEWRIVVTKAGFFNFIDEVQVVAEELLELEVELVWVHEPFEYGSISGVVNDPNGDPVSEARVIMSALGNAALIAETGEDGTFEFEEAAAVEWRLVVTKHGYFNFIDQVEVTADEELELEVELEWIRQPVEYGSVSGVVNDPDGEPLEEARVIMSSQGHAPLITETGEDGTFAFEEAAASEWRVVVTKIGYFNYIDDEAVVAVGEELELEVELEWIREPVEYGSLSGVVNDPDGEPLSEARILMSSIGHAPLITETGEDGTFLFEEAAATEWRVVVTKPGYFNFIDEAEVVVDEETELEIELRWVREPVEYGSVSGVVTTPDDGLIEGARVMMVSAGHAPLLADTEEDGSFAFEEAPAVEYRLVVTKIGFLNFIDEVEVLADEELELEIELAWVHEPIEFGSVSGVVTDPDGEPLEEARVLMSTMGQAPLLVETGEDGTFEFEEAAAAEWRIVVTRLGYFNVIDTIEVVVDEETEVEIELQWIQAPVEFGSVSGVVFDQEGEPIDEARVFMIAAGQVPLQAETDENGEFAFEEAAATEWTVVVVKHGYLVFREVAEVIAEEELELEIELEQPDDGGFMIFGLWGNIMDIQPVDESLNCLPGSIVDFEVFLYDEENNPPGVLWVVDEIPVSQLNWLSLECGDNGGHTISVYAWDEFQTVSKTWEISVSPASVEPDIEVSYPATPILSAPAPNPFNSQTTVSYYLPKVSDINLSLFDIQGRLVSTLLDEHRSAGYHTFNLIGGNLNSGVYFIRLSANQAVATRKVIYLK